MTKLIIIMLSAVFINNYVLSRFLGICPFLGVSKKLGSAAGMSIAVIFVMLMATAATYPIEKYLHTCYCCARAACRDSDEKIYACAASFTGSISSSDNNKLRCSGCYDTQYRRGLYLYRGYGEFARQRTGIFSCYGHVFGSALDYRGQRHTRKLQGTAYNSCGGCDNLTVIFRLRRSYRKPVCITEVLSNE